MILVSAFCCAFLAWVATDTLMLALYQHLAVSLLIGGGLASLTEIGMHLRTLAERPR